MKHMGQDERNRIAFIRDAKTSQTFTRIVNMLWEVAGPDLFRKLFRCIVPDNGTEFSDPEMVENCRPDPLRNPYKLLPRGVRVFYCDPYCSSGSSARTARRSSTCSASSGSRPTR